VDPSRAMATACAPWTGSSTEPPRRPGTTGGRHLYRGSVKAAHILSVMSILGEAVAASVIAVMLATGEALETYAEAEVGRSARQTPSVTVSSTPSRSHLRGWLACSDRPPSMSRNETHRRDTASSRLPRTGSACWRTTSTEPLA